MEVSVEGTNASIICASVFNNCDVAKSAESDFLHVNDVPVDRAQVDSRSSGQPLVE